MDMSVSHQITSHQLTLCDIIATPLSNLLEVPISNFQFPISQDDFKKNLMLTFLLSNIEF